MMTEKELLALKEKIEIATAQSNKLLGEQTAIMRELKQKFDVNTLEEAELLAATYKTKIEQFEEKISARITNLEFLIKNDKFS